MAVIVFRLSDFPTWAILTPLRARAREGSENHRGRSL